jgi:hypothetical protein
MAEIRINATGGVKLYDADDSHYAQIIAGTITSNTDVMTLGHNVINIPMTTASSSATTGALTIGGGLGVAADLYVGDDTYLITDSAVLGFGADKDTTLTHTDGTGLTLNSTNKLCFNDASQFVQGISATVLGLGATDEIDLTATAVDLNGTLDVSGTSLLTGRVGVVSAGDLGVGIHVRVADSGASVDSQPDTLVLEDSGGSGISILSGTSSSGEIAFGDSGDNNIGRIVYDHPNNDMYFTVNGTQAMIINDSQDVAFTDGTASLPSITHIGDVDTGMWFPAGNSIAFSVNGAEQMRVDTSGHLIIKGTAGITGTSLMVYNDTTESTAQFVNKATTGNHRGLDFTDGDGTLLGSINFNCGDDAVTFETSSDYRLKENVVDLTNAITRVKNLKPKRFNFIADETNTLRDGFLAHEVQDVVPEAGSGTKDETEIRENIVVNAKGNVHACNITEEEWTEGKSIGTFAGNTEWFAEKEFIRPQGMDSAKLVPLLTSALQEAITKIETLETKVTALEG